MEEYNRVLVFTKLFEEVYEPAVVQSMKEYLDKIGFFTAPASTKYHGNFPGGLFDHSFAVTKSLLSLTARLDLKWGREVSPYIVGMFHDLCKCDNYILKEDGSYDYDKNLILPGHGEKSIIVAQKFLRLTDEEIACIRWHMGAFDEKENWNRYGAAIEKYPNVLYTHTADMIAARIFKV